MFPPLPRNGEHSPHQPMIFAVLLPVLWASLLLVMSSPQPARGQDIPDVLAGPSSPDQAGYAHLSYAIPKSQANSNVYYEFHYEFCNRLSHNQAFQWKEVGFGMDIAAPVPPGMCALYERDGLTPDGLTPKRDLNTTLILSAGTHPAPAYLACDGQKQCGAQPEG